MTDHGLGPVPPRAHVGGAETEKAADEAAKAIHDREERAIRDTDHLHHRHERLEREATDRHARLSREGADLSERKRNEERWSEDRKARESRDRQSK